MSKVNGPERYKLGQGNNLRDSYHDKAVWNKDKKTIYETLTTTKQCAVLAPTFWLETAISQSWLLTQQNRYFSPIVVATDSKI